MEVLNNHNIVLGKLKKDKRQKTKTDTVGVLCFSWVEEDPLAILGDVLQCCRLAVEQLEPLGLGLDHIKCKYASLPLTATPPVSHSLTQWP